MTPGSWCEAYSREDCGHRVLAKDLPGCVLPKDPCEGMGVGQDDRVGMGLRDHVGPGRRHVTDLKIAAEDLRAVDLDPAIDADPPTVPEEAPDQIDAVGVVIEHPHWPAERLESIGRLDREGGT